MKILITGASGFVGGRVLEYYSTQKDASIIAIGRKFSIDKSQYPSVNFLETDLNNIDYNINVDVCIHCAGLASDKATKNQFFIDNQLATENLIKHLNCNKFVYISSSSVYNFKDGKTKSESDVIENNIETLYGKSKFETEQIVLKAPFNQVFVLRPRAIYGKGDRTLLPKIISLIKFNRMILPCNLSKKSSLTHVLNLIEAIDLSVKYSHTGKFIFNVADKETYDLNQVLKTIMIYKKGFYKPYFMPKFILKFLLFLNQYLTIKSKVNLQSISYLKDQSILANNEIINQLNYQGWFSFLDWEK